MRTIGTGVDGRVFTPTAQWLKTLEAVRAREGRLCALLPRGVELEGLLCRLITGSADATGACPRDGGATAEEYCKSVLSVPGGDRSARDLRERARVLLFLRGGAALPNDTDDLLALWAAATEGDARVYDNLPAHFRREGEHIPFSGGGTGRGVPRGWETVPPAAIPRETEALVRWIHTDADRETRAVCAYFLFGRIHPFCDGNGRTLRMLACALLSGGYSDATLLSYFGRLQADRPLLAEAESRANAGREDLSVFGCLLLRMLGMAQYSLELPLKSGAQTL